MSDCIFCKIVNKQIDADIIYQNETAILIKDKNPKAPHHVLAISKTHASHIGDVKDYLDVLSPMALCMEYAYDNKLNESGFRIVTNTGDDAGQTVQHFHVHLLGGAKLKDDFGA